MSEKGERATQPVSHATRRRMVSFAAVGASGVGVNLAGVWLAMQLMAMLSVSESWHEAVASMTGIVVSVFSNFVLNDRWTWGDRRTQRPWLLRLGRYYAVSALAGGVQFGVAMVLVQGAALHIYGAQLVAIGLGTGINYWVNNRWTFHAQPAAQSAQSSTNSR